jgi:predicted transcriptional regulator
VYTFAGQGSEHGGGCNFQPDSLVPKEITHGIKQAAASAAAIFILTKWFIGSKLKIRGLQAINQGGIFMDDLKLGLVESKFADIIWAHEPLHSRELVELCQRELNWKKPTTYTVLRKLCERGIFQNMDGLVTSRISRQDFFAMQSEKFVEDTFAGSLPAFLAAFTTRKSLTEEEIRQIRALIDNCQEG